MNALYNDTEYYVLRTTFLNWKYKERMRKHIVTYHIINVSVQQVCNRSVEKETHKHKFAKVSGITTTIQCFANVLIHFFISFDHSLILTIFFCQTQQGVNREARHKY